MQLSLANRRMDRVLTVVTLLLALLPLMGLAREWTAAPAMSAAPVFGALDSGRATMRFVARPGTDGVESRLEAVASGVEVGFVGPAVQMTWGETGETAEMVFAGANVDAAPVGINPASGRVNYLVGNDPANWVRGMTAYNAVQYQDLYPGVTATFVGAVQADGARLKSLFEVTPGVDPAVIRWVYGAGTAVELNAAGALVIDVNGDGVTDLVDEAPVAWQIHNGQSMPVAVAYALAPDGTVGFTVGAYDKRQPLVIDPNLVFSTYSGGSEDDWAYDVAVDGAGNSYVTGSTNSSNFPAIGYRGSNRNAFVSKYTQNGDWVFTTFVGGDGIDEGYAVAVDGAGDVYVTGTTTSADIPVIDGFDDLFEGGNEAFLMRITSSGEDILYSTFIGGAGEEVARDIAVDGAGNTYVSGYTNSFDFPVLNGFQMANAGGNDAFLVKINNGATALIWGTYLGGSGDDRADGMTIDAGGSAYVVGWTASSNYPMQNAYQGSRPGGDNDGFVTKINSDGLSLAYSTYLGGSAIDEVYAVAVDGSSQAYVVGGTSSTNFPTTGSAPQTGYGGGGRDAFVTKFAVNGTSLTYSSYLGGSGEERAFGVAVDNNTNVYLAGITWSDNFPVVDAYQPTRSTGALVEGFVTRLNSNGQSWAYSTYLGGEDDDQVMGIAVDGSGNATVAGWTKSVDFPTGGNPKQNTLAGKTDAFVFKFDANVTEATATSPATSTATAGGGATATSGGAATSTATSQPAVTTGPTNITGVIGTVSPTATQGIIGTATATATPSGPTITPGGPTATFTLIPQPTSTIAGAPVSTEGPDAPGEPLPTATPTQPPLVISTPDGGAGVVESPTPPAEDGESGGPFGLSPLVLVMIAGGVILIFLIIAAVVGYLLYVQQQERKRRQAAAAKKRRRRPAGDSGTAGAPSKRTPDGGGTQKTRPARTRPGAPQKRRPAGGKPPAGGRPAGKPAPPPAAPPPPPPQAPPKKDDEDDGEDPLSRLRRL